MIETTPADKKMVESFLTRKYKKLPFALPSAVAHKAVADREQKMAADLLLNAAEPTEIKRKIVQDSGEPVAVNRAIR